VKAYPRVKHDILTIYTYESETSIYLNIRFISKIVSWSILDLDSIFLDLKKVPFPKYYRMASE
jgi:hypothetical protein